MSKRTARHHKKAAGRATRRHRTTKAASRGRPALKESPAPIQVPVSAAALKDRTIFPTDPTVPFGLIEVFGIGPDEVVGPDGIPDASGVVEVVLEEDGMG